MDTPAIEAPAETTAAPVEATPAPEPTPIEATPGTANLLSGQETPAITPDTSSEPWFNQLDEEYRNDPNVTKYDSMNAMAKGLINQSALIGRKGIIKPGENATPEEMGDYFNQLGRPAESNMYKYEGEGEVDPDALSKYQEYAHKAGYSQEQYQSGIEFQQKFEADGLARFEQEKFDEASTTQRELTDELGEMEYNTLLQDAGAAAKSLGMYDMLVEHGLAGNKEVLKIFANANKSLGSSTLIGNNGSPAMNFDDQVASIRSAPGFSDKMHNDYKDLQKQMDDLYAARYPGK